MPELLLKIGNIDPDIQRPATEAVPQEVRGNFLPLPHLAGSRLLEACVLRHLVQQPLDLPRGYMALMPAREDVPAPPALQVCAERIEGRPGDDTGALLGALAIHHVPVSAGAVQVLGLQAGYFGNSKAAASHEPEEGCLSWGGGCGEEAVSLSK